MKKQILVLSAAVFALSAAPAFAQLDPVDDITTTLTDPIATSTADPATGGPADILLDEGGNLTLNFAGAAITVNSDNSVDITTDATVKNTNTTDAVGILVDLTTNSWNATNAAPSCLNPPCHTTEGILVDGALDLSGTGDNKTAIWLQGPASDSGLSANTFTGDIDMANATVTVTGDNSYGLHIDPLAIEQGNITFGVLNMQPTSTTTSLLGVTGFLDEGVVNGDVRVGFVDNTNKIDDVSDITIIGSTATGATGSIGIDITGMLNGNLTIDTGSSINVYGVGAQGIVVSGSINPLCDTETPPVCSSLGSLVNRGVILVAGTNDPGTATTGNPTSGSALAIGGSIAGGIYNAGPTHMDDTITGAQISAQSFAAAIEIAPLSTSTGTPVPITIGEYVGDTEDPGFSFYNRGLISENTPNVDQSVLGFGTSGISTAVTTLTEGIYNSGSLTAVTLSDSKGTGINAIAMSIGANSVIGPDDVYVWSDTCDCFLYNNQNPNGTRKLVLNDFGEDDQASLVNSSGSGSGIINATVSGPSSNNAAVAISIANNATLPSIMNSGTISAIATTGDTSITGLSATAILDASGTLTHIDNEGGTIEAIATTLDDGSQTAVAINLSGDTAGEAAGSGVDIIDHATANRSAAIIGDIVFGSGDHQIIDVLGLGTANTASIVGDIHYGSGGVEGSDELDIGNFATVVGSITSDNKVGVNVDVKNGGTLTITNDDAALYSAGFHIEQGGTLNLTVSEDFNTGIVVSVDGNADPNKDAISIDSGANLNITYGSWIPTSTKFILFTGNEVSVVDYKTVYEKELNDPSKLPFLFNDVKLDFESNPDGTTSFYLQVDPKNAADLGLTGYAAQMLPLVDQAVVNDDKLGAALIAGITDQKSAQTAFGQFAPDVTGGERAIAMSLTDQATGPVAARQRMLRMYGKDSGEVTLWGQEFAEFVKDPGNTSTGQTGYKDHGFGFALGLDGGDPKMGWYGGAVSFYSGDIVEAYPRDSHANTLWYMLTGYTDWRGKGLFLDTKVDVAYMTMKQKRYISLSIPNTSGSGSSSFIDEADSTRPGLVGSAGFTTGVILAYGSTTLTPQLSMDAMTMRVDGATESHPTASPGNGDGFDLAMKSYYSNSMRVFLGADVREDLDMGDFFIQPDVRLGYRYDFISDPTKLTAHFVSTPNTDFTITGPDPSQGNFVAGASLSATTDAWTLGANFDFVRGSNGATTEVGTIHLLGRI
ncbi:MAG TPA: autotransporter outer membrane beta-barrel domain-containing protein [Rhizomicrobium sp.]|nr:autotransporter outer membrane beta-barrel domain-containing protein [Rhizomicrobium sp.]